MHFSALCTVLNGVSCILCRHHRDVSKQEGGKLQRLQDWYAYEVPKSLLFCFVALLHTLGLLVLGPAFASCLKSAAAIVLAWSPVSHAWRCTNSLEEYYSGSYQRNYSDQDCQNKPKNCTTYYLRQCMTDSCFQLLPISKLHVHRVMCRELGDNCVQDSSLLTNKSTNISCIVCNYQAEHHTYWK
jgi:hypothetical protein